MDTLEFSTYPSKKGDVYGTTFTFAKTNFPSYINTIWDFGDGHTSYNELSVSHVYKYPGFYTVTLSAWSPTGELHVAYEFIDVDYVHRDAIKITNMPTTWGLPGAYTNEPFYVSLTSAKIDQPLSLILHSINSKSLPYDVVDGKWNFLNPRWRFINALTNELVTSSIQLTSGPIYKNNVVVAVSSEAAFYYIDDMPTMDPEPACPVILLATLSTENFSYPPESLIYPYYSYSNNEMVQAAVIWQIQNAVPTALSVTENYLNDIYYFKWTNVPIPIMINCKFDASLLSTYDYASGYPVTDVLDYPKKNEYGLVNSLDIKLHGYDSNEYVVENAPLYFQRTDENGLPIGGYIFTTITPLVSSKNASTTYVTVSSATIYSTDSATTFPFPYAYPVDSFAFITHSYENNINKIQLASYDTECEIVKKFKKEGFLTDGFIRCIEVPALSTASTKNLEVSGISNIYGLSYDPINKILYGADADRNVLYAIDASTDQIINTTAISAATNNLYDTPSYVSIDSNHNVWVALYDSSTLIKYDKTLQTVLASATPVLSAYHLLDETGSPLIEPSVVETDRDDNVWACYSHPLSSLLVKYDSQGVQLTSHNFGYNAVPCSVAIDRHNNVWTACYDSNKVELFDTSGAHLSSYEFLKPSYVSIDRKNNLWILHGYNLCSFLNTKTHEVSSWKLDTVLKKKELVFSNHTPISGYSFEDRNNTIQLNEIWGGLSIDVFDRVWLVDSERNSFVVFSTKNPEQYEFFAVAPKATTNFIVQSNNNFTTEIQTSVVRSAQANGDWTGNRWYQKYATKGFTGTMSGSSTPFKVTNLDDTYFNIAKVNDNFNIGSYMKSLALPEALSKNSEFFDNFLPAMIGSNEEGKKDIGKTLYERIANFGINHSDVDTAEIPQLLALAEQVNMPGKQFGIDFPVEINHYLNLFSIPRKHLMGTEKLDPDFRNTIGPLINFTDTVSAGMYIYAKDRQYETYQLIYVNQTVNGVSYPLSAIKIDGLRDPLVDNYYFFYYEPQTLGYNSSVVDWTSPRTTLNRTVSADEAWYGDDQIIDLHFNNLLTKRLFSK